MNQLFELLQICLFFRFTKGTYQNGWIMVESPCRGECYNKKCNIKDPGDGINPSIAECYKPGNPDLNSTIYNSCKSCRSIRNHDADDNFAPDCGPNKKSPLETPKGVKCEV